jgi:transaldolase
MGASFRNAGQILALAGCDLLTISPELLDDLAGATGDVPRALSAPDSAQDEPPLAEAAFRYSLNDDAMATEKLAEGIRVFAADSRRLEQMIATLD